MLFKPGAMRRYMNGELDDDMFDWGALRISEDLTILYDLMTQGMKIPESATRLKYRYYHKHRGFVEAFEESLCVGCGRCGISCLGGITVPEVIASVQSHVRIRLFGVVHVVGQGLKPNDGVDPFDELNLHRQPLGLQVDLVAVDAPTDVRASAVGRVAVNEVDLEGGPKSRLLVQQAGRVVEEAEESLLRIVRSILDGGGLVRPEEASSHQPSPQGIENGDVGRGKTVVTDALVAALESGAVSAAGLDVTDPEPLPADHILWGRDDVIITPHVASSGGEYERHGVLLRENIRRYVAGDALLNLVDPERGY